MKTRRNKHLQGDLEEAYSDARPRRNGANGFPKAILAEMLVEAEAAVIAMRYLDAKGRMAGKATPKLREHLKDLETDARADEEHEAV